MPIVPSRFLVQKALHEGYAVPSFCVWNAETIETVLETAHARRAPVILMNGPGEFGLFSPAILGELVRALAAKYPVEIAMHLDHGDTMEIVQTCLHAGYSSVMLDYSQKPFRENIDALRTVAELSRHTGASVEGELGAVGRVDGDGSEGSNEGTLTNPDQAREFVEATGVDMLAVSIGNAHGIYRSRPRLDFARLEQIRKAASVPLVLHGGSGTPPEDIRRAIGMGIAKINVASELVKATSQTLMELWTAGKEPWVPQALARARVALAKVVGKWMAVCDAEGKAGEPRATEPGAAG